MRFETTAYPLALLSVVLLVEISYTQLGTGLRCPDGGISSVTGRGRMRLLRRRQLHNLMPIGMHQQSS
jgi:hypothetical protein